MQFPFFQTRPSFAADVTGFSDYAQDIDDFTAITELRGYIGSSFLTLCGKIRSGDYTKEELDLFQTSFEFLKASAIEEYEAMLSIEDDATRKKEISEKLEEIRSWSP